MSTQFTRRRVLALSAIGLAAGQRALAAPQLARQPANIAEVVRSSNAWLEIDAEAFEHNLRQMQSLVKAPTQICVVMKADAYGHGIELLMPSVLKLKIPCIGITSNDEARIARLSGFKGRVLRLRAATLAEMNAGMRWGIEEMLGNAEMARELAAAARQRGRNVKFHLALNSGEMDRNGLEVGTELGRRQALQMLTLPGLEPVGIMTHFALDDKAKIAAGLAEFERDANALIVQAGLKRERIVLHTANSLLTVEMPESHFDMVRPGRALYGYWPRPDAGFKKAMALKTRVASVNDYPAGSGVSYDHAFVLQRDSRLANIPVGYSDGYRRVFANKAQVLIHGKRAPIVGKITMNTFMVDVTDLPEVQAGDEVVLYGRQGDQEITQGELQKIMGDILVDMATPWAFANPRILAPRRGSAEGGGPQRSAR